MEKHRCKLCFRSFSNGRALGGHMRSHMMTLPVPSKREEEDPPPPPPPPATSPAPVELNEEADSASSSSSSSEDEDEGKEAYYGLRENPKRSIKLVDPEFSFAVAVDAGSVVLQDRESETESSKNPTRRRSKRSRKSSSSNSNSDHDHHHHRRHHYIQLVQNSSPSPDKKIKSSELSEQVSSVVSDATTDEDIAFCLMMLSRDNWNRENDEREENEEEDDYEEVEDEEEEESENHEESDEEMTTKNWKSSNNNSNSRTKRTGKYKCDTCNKVFRSYQALGGHRASHKKIKQQISTSPVTDVIDETRELLRANAGTVAIAQQVKKSIHECPVCFRVFSSGQALGGHKRSHVITGNSAPIQQPKLIASFSDNNNNDNNPSFAAATITTKKSLSKIGDHQISLIDLNLPAPDDDEDKDEDDQDHDDDDEISQIELSAVSDAEFVNSIR